MSKNYFEFKYKSIRKVMKKSAYSYGIALVAAFIFLRSFFVPAYKFLTEKMHPFAIDFYTIIASIIVFGFLTGWKLKGFKSLGKEKRKEYFILVLPAIAGALALDLSILYLPVKSFQVFISALPIFIGFYSVILLKEPLSKSLWLAAGLAAFGGIVFKNAGGFEFGIGDFLVLAGVALFSLYPIINRKFVSIVGTRELMLMSALLTLLPAFVLAAWLGVLTLPPADPIFLTVFFGFIFLLSLGSNAIAISVVRYIQPSIFATLSTALIPIGAVLIAILTLGETLQANEILGGAIMISAAVLAAWASNNRK